MEKIPLEVGQMLHHHVHSKGDETDLYYNLLVVTEVMDQQFYAINQHGDKLAFSHHELRSTLANHEEGVMVLTKNGHPVYSRKNLFGRYLFQSIVYPFASEKRRKWKE